MNSHGRAAVLCVGVVVPSDARVGYKGYRSGYRKAAGKFETFPPLLRWCPRWDSNPHSEEPDFESGASANSATRAYHAFVRNTFRILTQAV